MARRLRLLSNDKGSRKDQNDEQDDSGRIHDAHCQSTRVLGGISPPRTVVELVNAV